VARWRKKFYEYNGRKLSCEERLGTDFYDQIPAPTDFDLEQTWNAEWEKHLWKAATDRVKRRVAPEQYQMFYLHVTKQIPAKEVARRLHVKLPTVYFAKYKVAAAIKKEVARLEKKGV
jgi:hypothetical protein